MGVGFISGIEEYLKKSEWKLHLPDMEDMILFLGRSQFQNLDYIYLFM